MDFLNSAIIWVGFSMAALSIIGNDVIQTLGTFLSSNERKFPWYVLYAFIAVILTIVLIYGWWQDDIAFGRLDKIVISISDTLQWYYLLPPLTLILITRFGIPVSTTFMILTIFSMDSLSSDIGILFTSIMDPKSVLGLMIIKSMSGYLVAFVLAITLYLLFSKVTEWVFINKPITGDQKKIWLVLQWFSTGFLWMQWLIQDLANIYVYLVGPMKTLSAIEFFISLIILLSLLAYIFYLKGGAVQKIVKVKTNTEDIRSATIIDFIYGVVLFLFKDDILGIWGGKIPMSTTWIFLGLLAGRELGINLRLYQKIGIATLKNLSFDLVKIFTGLVVSVLLVVIIKVIAG